MTLRPVPARWFELVTTREELAAVLGALAHSGVVELETFTRPSEALFAPDVQDALNAYSDLEKRYRAYWPEPESTGLDHIGAPEALLAAGLDALERWCMAADPLIEEIERLRRQRREFERLHRLLADCPEPLPDLVKLGHCGPDLAARLFLLPQKVAALNLPELMLHKRFHRPGGDYLLVLGGARDVAGQAEQLYAMKARTVPIPDDLPPAAAEAAEDVAARLDRLHAAIKEAEAKLAALSASHDVARIRARSELIAWLASHAGKLSATPRLASVTSHTKRYVRCFWGLDRERAQARFYPAIHPLQSYSEDARRFAGWWTERGNPDWASQRERLLTLLERQAHLERMARIVGKDALPAEQQLTLTCAELVNEALLRQSAFSAVDRYCSPERQTEMLRLVIRFIDLAFAALEGGAAPEEIAGVTVYRRLQRMGEDIGEDQLARFAEIRAELDQQLGGLGARQEQAHVG